MCELKRIFGELVAREAQCLYIDALEVITSGNSVNIVVREVNRAYSEDALCVEHVREDLQHVVGYGEGLDIVHCEENLTALVVRNLLYPVIVKINLHRSNLASQSLDSLDFVVDKIKKADFLEAAEIFALESIQFVVPEIENLDFVAARTLGKGAHELVALLGCPLAVVSEVD